MRRIAWPRCFILGLDGAIHSSERKEALWDKSVTAVPRPCTPSELQHSDRKLDRGTEPGIRDQSEDGHEVAQARNGRRSQGRSEGVGSHLLNERNCRGFRPTGQMKGQ